MSYLVEKGILVYARAVATFLLENCDKLDKTQIGEYLGKEIHYKDGFCVQVCREGDGRGVKHFTIWYLVVLSRSSLEEIGGGLSLPLV